MESENFYYMSYSVSDAIWECGIKVKVKLILDAIESQENSSLKVIHSVTEGLSACHTLPLSQNSQGSYYKH